MRLGVYPSPLSLRLSLCLLGTPVTPTWTDRTSNLDRFSGVGVEAGNSQDLDLTVSGFWQSHESGSSSLSPACEGAWQQSQKALNRSRVGSWESSNKINVNIANIWECFIKHLKKIPHINPNPVLQALRTMGCPTFWLWTPRFRFT